MHPIYFARFECGEENRILSGRWPTEASIDRKRHRAGGCTQGSDILKEGRIERRLAALNIELPAPPVAAANYLPYARYGDLIQLAGVAPTEHGAYAVVGRIGDDLSLQDGRRAARLCALNALANLREACDGDLDRVSRFMMVRGFVNAAERFSDIPLVVDGASDLIVDIFGATIGRHARTSIGCATLPGGVAVEVDALVLVDQG